MRIVVAYHTKQDSLSHTAKRTWLMLFLSQLFYGNISSNEIGIEATEACYINQNCFSSDSNVTKWLV